MSVIGSLLEIPPSLLELFKIYPEAKYLYYRASSDREKQNIGSISKLCMSHREIAREIYFNNRHKIGQILNSKDCESVILYKKYNTEEYFMVKDHICEIIEQGKISHHLYLGRNWDLINFLFSGSYSTSIPNLVIWNKSFIGLNPILFKQHSLGFDGLEYYYLEVEEVKTLSELMQDFGDEIIHENLKHVLDYWPKIPDILWVKDLCDSVKDFYLKVEENENSILIGIN